MRTIDAFNHFFPKRYYDALLETPAGSKDLGKRVLYYGRTGETHTEYFPGTRPQAQT